jgi:hypothetical protein
MIADNLLISDVYGYDESIIRDIGADNMDELSTKFNSSPFSLHPSIYGDFIMSPKYKNTLLHGFFYLLPDTAIESDFDNTKMDLVYFEGFKQVSGYTLDFGYIVEQIYTDLDDIEYIEYEVVYPLEQDGDIYSEVYINNKLHLG